MNSLDFINQKIRTAKDLDFGTIFNESIELFKKTWVQGLLMQVFAIIIMLPVIIIAYVPIIAAAIAQQEAGGYNDDPSAILAGFSIVFMLILTVAMIVLGAVIAAIGAGFYRIMKRIDHGEPVLTKDFFHFVKGKYLGKFLGFMLISILIAIPAALLCYIPLLYVMVPMSLFTPIFAYNPHLGVMDVVKTSFNLGNKKWLLLFGLIMVSSILAQMVGLLACGIGIFVTASFVYHPVYIVYKKVVGFGQDDAIAEIGQAQE